MLPERIWGKGGPVGNTAGKRRGRTLETTHQCCSGPVRRRCGSPASLPTSFDEVDSVGYARSEYAELASSSGVLNEVIRALGLESTPGMLRESYEFDLDDNTSMLRVKASAEEPESAASLLVNWHQVFQEQIRARLQSQLEEQLVLAQSRYDEAVSRVEDAEDALDEFNAHYLLGLEEEQLESLQDDLVASERELRQTRIDISSDSARRRVLSKSLEEQPETFGGDDAQAVVPDDTSRLSAAGRVLMVNPVYIALSEELVTVETRLEAKKAEAEALEAQIESMKEELESLNSMLATKATERKRLERSVEQAETVFSDAEARLQTLRDLEKRMGVLTQVRVVSEPTLPESPVAPRRMLNMAVAGILALFMAVFVVFFMKFWEGGSESSKT